MAGTQFMKLKRGQVHAIIRHDMREHNDYSNTDIDRSKSDLNVTIGFKGYRSADGIRQRLKERMAKVEETNTNHRKDRVEAFSLLFYVPEGLSYEESKRWMKLCMGILCEKYGYENFIGGFGHFDEIHTYVDPETKETRLSRPHITGIVIPEHEGQLNGKWFSSRQNIRDVNDRVQAMTEKEFPGHTYMTGTGKKSRKTVEQLKNESDYAKWELEAEKMKSEADNFRSKRDKLEKEVTGLEERKTALQDELDAKLDEYGRLVDEIEELVKQSRELDKEIRSKQKVMTEQQKQKYEAAQKKFMNKAREMSDNDIEIEL